MSVQRVKSAGDAKERLILAAEQEFALSGTRARVADIIRTAGCGNAAAINYHFQSREGLLMVCRTYREQPLNLFRERLYQVLCEEIGEEAFNLSHYYFLLIAPSAAVIGQLLPASYYGRFVANCKTYSLRGLEERKSNDWAKTVIHCMRQVYAGLQESLPPKLLALRASLYEHHIAQSLAQMEVVLMRRLEAGEELTQVQADIPALTVELSSHMVFLLLQEKVSGVVDLSIPASVLGELLRSGPPLQFKLPA